MRKRRPVITRFKGWKFRPKRNIVIFDTETVSVERRVRKFTKKESFYEGKVQKLYMIGFKKVFPEKSDFYFYKDGKYGVQKMLEMFNKEGGYIFAHNLGFDFQVILPFLFRLPIELKYIIPESDVFLVFSIWKKKIPITWISTTNFVKASLEKIGEKYNLKKLEIEYDEIGKKVSDNELKIYLKRDLQILEKLVETLIHIHQKYDLKILPTVSALAFNIWRKHFIPENTTIYLKRPKTVRAIERSAYYGGRVEVFRDYLKKGYYLDFTSLYPSVMRNGIFPTKFLGTLENIGENELKKLMKKYHVIAELYTIENSFIPLLPIKMNGKLIFPNGRKVSFYSHAETEKALELGIVQKIGKVLIYRKEPNLFTDFVDYFFKKKNEETNKAFRLFWKYILNGLSGKFGQKVNIIKQIENIGIVGFYNGYFYDDETGEEKRILVLGEDTFEFSKEEVDSFYNFTSIIAEITSKARVKLFEALNKVSEYVYYCDTDSLFVDENGFEILMSEGLVENKVLGKLKIEAIVKDVHFLVPKSYIGTFIENDEEKVVRKFKGIPKKFKEIAEGKFKGQKFTKFKETLRFCRIPNPIVIEIQKELSLKDEKRKKVNGIRVPLEVNLW